jgi:hypothetical protein
MKSTRWAALGAALVVLACGAPAASAESIAYIKDGNVWLSTTDGSRQFQVTSSGAYADVSQADDGTMVALTGVRLHRLDRMGNVLNDFATPVSNNVSAPGRFLGPFDPAISPDGTKVAYTYYWLSQTQSPDCMPPKCQIALNEGGTGYSWANRNETTGWDEPGLGYHSGWRHPTWVDNDMTMLSNPTHLPNSDVILDRISDGGNGHGNMVMNWFSDLQDNPHMTGGDISRDKRVMAFQTGPNDNTLTVYYVRAFPTGWKDSEAVGYDLRRCYRYTRPETQSYGIPTLSPDGTGLAFSEADGIHIAAVPRFGADCTLEGATPEPPLVIPGAKEPDWGPADVPTGRPTQPITPPVDPGEPTKPTNPATFTTKVTSATRSGGVKLSVKVPGSGKLTATAKVGKKVVGKASKTITRAGTAALKLKVKAKGKVKVTVTFKPATGKATTKTLTVKVRS